MLWTTQTKFFSAHCIQTSKTETSHKLNILNINWSYVCSQTKPGYEWPCGWCYSFRLLCTGVIHTMSQLVATWDMPLKKRQELHLNWMQVVQASSFFDSCSRKGTGITYNVSNISRKQLNGIKHSVILLFISFDHFIISLFWALEHLYLSLLLASQIRAWHEANLLKHISDLMIQMIRESFCDFQLWLWPQQ